MNIETDVANEWRTGVITVGTSVIRLSTISELANFRCTRGIQIKAHPTNATGEYVLVGQSDVETVGNNGYPLFPSDAIFIPIRDLGKIHLIASVADQTVNYLAV